MLLSTGYLIYSNILETLNKETRICYNSKENFRKETSNMNKVLKRTIAGLLIVPFLALGVAFVVDPGATVSAQTIFDGAQAGQGEGTPESLFDGSDSIFKTVVNILLYVIGAVAVVMLIVGGIRYTVSNGDSNQITGAKNTILYAIVGLIIAFLAYAIVNWVLTGLGTAA